MKLCFFSSCVNWPQGHVDALSAMIDAGCDITRRTFRARVDVNDLARLERDCGYVAHPSQGLTMAGDNYVSYHRSKINGVVVYYFRWSAIEYVFTSGGEFDFEEAS